MLLRWREDVERQARNGTVVVYLLIQIILFDRDVFQKSYKSLKMAHGGLKVARAVFCMVVYSKIIPPARVGYEIMRELKVSP